MSKNNCCCGGGPGPGLTFDTFCCNPLLFTDFITLYGDSMAQHAEVSPGDWIALKQTREIPSTTEANCAFKSTGSCNCCCDCATSAALGKNVDKETGNNTSLNANNLFDKNNKDGVIIKNGKPKPQNKKRVDNGFFFSGTKLNLSRQKETNPSIIKKTNLNGTVSYNYNFSFTKNIATDPTNKAQNISSGENVTLVFGEEKVEGNYVLGDEVDISKPIVFTDQFQENTTPAFSTDSDQGGVPPFGEVERNDWENEIPCVWKCNTLFCCEDATTCPRTPCEDCCCRHREVIGVRGYQPAYFAYKYSGCHFTWYPREMLFGKDPYVPQCMNNEVQTLGIYCPPYDANDFSIKKVTTSCGVMSMSAPWQGTVSRRDVDIPFWCSEANPPALQTRITTVPGTINHWACHCATVPHIHGGMVDSLTNTINVSQRPGQLGYVSQFRPFYPPMEASDLGCCWCSSVNPPSPAGIQFPVPEWMGTKAGCNTYYPFTNGIGKVPNFTNPCAPGFACHYFHGINPNYLTGNPGYTTECFRNGISPYLQKVAKTRFKAAYEIFLHGDGAFNDFGPNYVLSEIKVNMLLRDYEIAFREVPNAKTSLRDQCLGFVQLEHHFECCAFRSDVGIATKNPGILINNCNIRIPPFESEGYAGHFTPASGPTCFTAAPTSGKVRAKYTPYHYSACMWQIKRGIPRRVMYAGSGIPIFKFDLVNMENWTLKNPNRVLDLPAFTVERFIEHYYRYYFGLISFNGGGCGANGQPPEPIEWSYGHYINSYEYVTGWLEKMVEAGILRIKDHAIDIAKEVNQLVGSAYYDSSGVLVISPEAAKECGGVNGFFDLLNFFEVSPGDISVTPKKVKEKLFNTAGAYSYDGPGTETGSNATFMRAFLPRRARLPIGPLNSKVEAWGCNGNSPTTQIEGCTTCFGLSIDGVSCCLPEINCPSYVIDSINVPPLLNTTEGNFSDIQPNKVICGLAGTFVIDRIGKLAIFGGIPVGGDMTSCPSTIRTGYPGNPSAEFDLNCSYDMHPNSIVNIPWYLNIFSAFDLDPTSSNFGQMLSYGEIPDGKVLDIVFNPNFAVALCEFDKDGIGNVCLDTGLPGEVSSSWKPTWEWNEWSVAYQTTNTNGSNVSLRYNPSQSSWDSLCITNEPWGTAPGDIIDDGNGNEGDPNNTQVSVSADNPGARSSYSNSPKYTSYRLKSWGSKGKDYGTFSLSKEDSVVFNYGSKYNQPSWACPDEGEIETQINVTRQCSCGEFNSENGFENGYRGYDPTINPENLRYPGTNTWFIWNKIAGGLKHFAALDDFGGVFITALSDNEDGQSAKGKPLPYFDIERQESWPQQGYSDPKTYAPDYNGFESRFNYFNHIPRPGFINKEDWTQDLYNSLTSRFSPWLNCNGACAVSVTTGPAAGPNNTQINPCNVFNFASKIDNVAADSPKIDQCYDNTDLVGGNVQFSPCVQPIKLRDGTTCTFPDPASGNPNIQNRLFDLSTHFMGSFCQRGVQDDNFNANTESSYNCKPAYVILQQDFNNFQPRYVDLAAGAFNTMLLTNENRIELYGKYYQIDENGNKIGPKIKITNQDGSVSEVIKGITCYVPNSVLQKQGIWGITYGCPTYCRGITFDVNGSEFANTRGITHNPIISASYKEPSQNDIFQIIKSSADYSLAITKDNKIFVWGDASMVPGAYFKDTYIPGLTAEAELSLANIDTAYASVLNTIPSERIKITNVAVGIHSFYISYQILTTNIGLPLHRNCVYSRYGRSDFGAELPSNLQNKKLISISAGNGFAVAITSDGEGPKTWNSSHFAPETIKYQYKNFDSLPLYFRRDAYFHAIPGNWDYSKWIWGDTCCFAIHDPDHPCLKEDRCSALAYSIYRDFAGNPLSSTIPDNDPRRFNVRKSYSGHPEHLFARSDMRRISSQTIGNIGLAYDDNNTLANCNAESVDGARPAFGTGALIGELNDDFNFCFQSTGPGWGSFVPNSPLSKIRTKKPSRFGSCINDACSDRPSSKNRGVCSDFWGAYLCSTTQPSIQSSFSATKDIFQQKVISWGDNPIGNNVCRSFLGYTVDYFKYSQRNFYLGYDSEKDTWEIYNNPDIFKNTLINKPIMTDTCCEANPDPDNCPSSNPAAWLCPGATTFTDPTNCGWGGGITQGTAGCTSWPSLAGYPMVGPNYTRYDTNVIPPHYPRDSQILYALLMSDGAVSGGNPCSINPCYSLANRELVVGRFAGPGGFAFNVELINCNNTINTDNYTYKPVALISETPFTLLKGVQSSISTTIPPENDPDYKSIGFRKVLDDPNYTNINLGDFINKLPQEHFFRFGNYGLPGTAGKVIADNHGLVAGNMVIFKNYRDRGYTGEGGVIREVRIKLNPANQNNNENFLQLEKEYFVSNRNLFENSFSITETIEDALSGNNIIPFWVATNYGGTTADSYEVNTKWYPMFDEIPSNYHGIAGTSLADTGCFIGGTEDCYELDSNGVAPIDGQHVILLTSPMGVGTIVGMLWLCILQDCCGAE